MIKENNIQDVSILMGLKNCWELSQHAYGLIRQQYPDIEVCLVSNGSTDKTNEWLDSLDDPNTLVYHDDTAVAYSATWNRAISMATKPYVVMVHNDMALGRNFIENLIKHATNKTIVCYSTIEPPIFTNIDRPGKVIVDLGNSFETLNFQRFNEITEELMEQNAGKAEKFRGTILAMFPREKLVEIGGLDPFFNPMFCEDDDLLLRCRMKGLYPLASLDAICYHMVSKTSRFSEEFKDKTNVIERDSNFNFVRKWGFRNSKHEKKYNIGLVGTNCNDQILDVIEPWFSTLYVDCDIEPYIKRTQPNTSIDLRAKLKPISEQPTNDIVVSLDVAKLSQLSMSFIVNLSDIITESGEVGEMEHDIFTVLINQVKSIDCDLIHRGNLIP